MANPYETPFGPEEMAIPLWHRQAVGGLWDEIGNLQFDFLRAHGLRAHDQLLDIGCGSLRGGIHFIRNLDPGHYVGIDIRQELLDAGHDEVIANDLLSRHPTLICMADFTFHQLNRHFSYALAISVFTHMPLNSIIRCLVNVEAALAPGGQFFATFFENPAGKANLEPIVQSHYEDGSPVRSYFDRDPYHYDIATFASLCHDTTLAVEYLGDWGHPRNQKMLVFRKRKRRFSRLGGAWLARRRGAA